MKDCPWHPNIPSDGELRYESESANTGGQNRNLIHSALNALASTANYLKNYGWASGQPWSEGTGNFLVLQKWNESEVYAKTVAYFATRLEKEP